MSQTPPADLRKSADEPAPGTPAAERGRTVLAVGVVEKTAGMAAREVPGIHALGSGPVRGFGAVRGSGARPGTGRAIKAEVGEKQTAIDLAVVVEYGVVIPEVAREVRENVIEAVERTTGLEVVEVNIAINDVHLPDEPDVEEGEPSGRRTRIE